MGFGESGRHLF